MLKDTLNHARHRWVCGSLLISVAVGLIHFSQTGFYIWAGLKPPYSMIRPFLAMVASFSMTFAIVFFGLAESTEEFQLATFLREARKNWKHWLKMYVFACYCVMPGIIFKSGRKIYIENFFIIEAAVKNSSDKNATALSRLAVQEMPKKLMRHIILCCVIVVFLNVSIVHLRYSLPITLIIVSCGKIILAFTILYLSRLYVYLTRKQEINDLILQEIQVPNLTWKKTIWMSLKASFFFTFVVFSAVATVAFFYFQFLK